MVKRGHVDIGSCILGYRLAAEPGLLGDIVTAEARLIGYVSDHIHQADHIDCRCESSRKALNGKHCNIASALVKQGDTVAIKSRPRSLGYVRTVTQDQRPVTPDFLEMVGTEPPQARVSRLPSRGDVDPRIAEIREQLIIELVNR